MRRHLKFAYYISVRLQKIVLLSKLVRTNKTDLNILVFRQSQIIASDRKQTDNYETQFYKHLVKHTSDIS
jgi:hypothetical protein